MLWAGSEFLTHFILSNEANILQDLKQEPLILEARALIEPRADIISSLLSTAIRRPALQKRCDFLGCHTRFIFGSAERAGHLIAERI
jgi:hypothetical protein